MELEKNKKTRQVVRKFLQIGDRVGGIPFPGMKRVKQITVYHCGPAVLEALFSYVGLKISQTAVVRSLRARKKIKNFGLNPHDLARATGILGKKKYVFWKKANATIANLAAAIDKYKYPVGVEWQGVFYELADEDDGHYSIVTKVDKANGFIRMADSFRPFAGVDRRFKIKNFEKRWWDSNEIKISGTSKPRTIVDKKIMFVITPKGETWPRKLGMKTV